MNFEVESGKSIKLLTKNKVCTDDITITAIGGGVDHSSEDALISSMVSEYSNDRVTALRSYAFYKNTALSSITLPSVTSIGSYAFDGCIKLTNVRFPAVTEVKGDAFNRCFGLISVSLPLANLSGTYAFANCTKLTDADISSVDQIPSHTFSGCQSLKKIVLPSVVSIAAAAFNNAKSLEAVILPLTQMATLGAASAFTGTPVANGTGYIYVPQSLIEDYKVATNWVTYANQFRAIEDYPDVYGGAQ